MSDVRLLSGERRRVSTYAMWTLPAWMVLVLWIWAKTYHSFDIEWHLVRVLELTFFKVKCKHFGQDSNCKFCNCSQSFDSIFCIAWNYLVWISSSFQLQLLQIYQKHGSTYFKLCWKSHCLLNYWSGSLWDIICAIYFVHSFLCS